MSAIQGERTVLEQEKGNPVNLVVTSDEFYKPLITRLNHLYLANAFIKRLRHQTHRTKLSS